MKNCQRSFEGQHHGSLHMNLKGRKSELNQNNEVLIHKAANNHTFKSFLENFVTTSLLGEARNLA